jgi:cytochrome c553
MKKLLSMGLIAAATTAGAQPAAPASDAAFTVPDTIAQRVAACTACHGQQGRSTPDGYFPRIAGKPAGYLYNQLVNFREGRRHYAPMITMVDLMSDAYLHEIAGYFASLDLPYAPPPPATDVEAARHGEALVRRGDAERGIPACQACHGAALTGVLPAIPGLVGLPRDYLNGQLGGWKNQQRHAAAPDCMATIAAKLTPDDISAITHWMSAQVVPADSHPAPATSIERLPMACGSVPQ